MSSVGPDPSHTCEFEDADYAICEDMAVIVHWTCDYQPGSYVSGGRGESYFAPSGPPCEATESARFELQYTEFRGKRCDGDWEQWCASRDDAYSVLDGTEIDAREPHEHERVADFDVDWTPNGTHGQIVLEAQTEYGYIQAVFEQENDRDS